MRDMTGNAAAPAVRCKNCLRWVAFMRHLFRATLTRVQYRSLPSTRRPHIVIMLFCDASIALLRWGSKMRLSDRIGRNIKLHDLHVLIAVVQIGSMSKAAAIL